MGDALGTKVEFEALGTFALLTDIVGGGPFDLELAVPSSGKSLLRSLEVAMLFNRLKQRCGRSINLQPLKMAVCSQ